MLQCQSVAQHSQVVSLPSRAFAYNHALALGLDTNVANT